MTDLLSAQDNKAEHAPLAERMRPQTIDEMIGQTHLFGAGKLLRIAFGLGRLHCG